MTQQDRERAAARFDQAARLLPFALRRIALDLPEETRARAEELRLRAGRRPTLVGPGGEEALPGAGAVTAAELEAVLEVASRASMHAVLEQLRHGFLTVEGGHRVGLCASAVMRDGEVGGLRQISSLAIRVARQVPGIARPLLGRLCDEEGTLHSTLILSPPGHGKTTLLRDLIRCVADGDGTRPLRVGVADERGELAAMEGGLAQMELGLRADVMDHCPKGPALMMLLRGMNPQVLAVDEITAEEDSRALEAAAGCGVKLLATAHGRTLDDLRRRPVYRGLLEQGIFGWVVVISVEEGRRRYRVWASTGEGQEC